MTDNHHETTEILLPTITDKDNGIDSTIVSQAPIVDDKTDTVKKQKEYKITKQFEDWVQYFTTREILVKRIKRVPVKDGDYIRWESKEVEEETYGNKTLSAIKAYNLDPVKKYTVAGSMGYQNYKKLQHMASVYADENGFTVNKLWDYAFARMMTANSGKEWWDEIMIATGNKLPSNVLPNQDSVNTQINVFNLGSPEVLDFNSKFQKFLESQ